MKLESYLSSALALCRCVAGPVPVSSTARVILRGKGKVDRLSLDNFPQRNLTYLECDDLEYGEHWSEEEIY